MRLGYGLIQTALVLDIYLKYSYSIYVLIFYIKKYDHASNFQNR